MYYHTFYRSTKQKYKVSLSFFAKTLYLTVSVSLQRQISSSQGSVELINEKQKHFLHCSASALLYDFISIQLFNIPSNKSSLIHTPSSHPYNIYHHMAYEMKKSLRKTNMVKNYMEPDEEGDPRKLELGKEQKGAVLKESIFQHKNWSPKEKVKLMVFLEYYHALPDWFSERRSIYLYKHLSNFLRKTRTPEQCKNIHSLLKRKFPTLEEVIGAMQKQLKGEENYDKMISKYERQIEKFQSENKLFTGIQDQKRTIQPFRYKKYTDRSQGREQPYLKGETMRENDQSDNLRINLTNYIKQQEMYTGKDKTTHKLAKQCQFHFNEWLKCAMVLEYKKKSEEGSQ